MLLAQVADAQPAPAAPSSTLPAPGPMVSARAAAVSHASCAACFQIHLSRLRHGPKDAATAWWGGWLSVRAWIQCVGGVRP